MKNLSKCQKMMTTQQEIYYIFHIIKIFMNSLDLSRQTNTNIPQQINFTGKLEKDDGATMFFIAEKQQKTVQLYIFL